jgi:hypothetical protein
MSVRVGNQWSHGVVIARLQSSVRSLLHQCRHLLQSTYLYHSEDGEPTSHQSGAERPSTSTYKRKGTEGGMEIIDEQSCGTCGVKGHYTTTCPRNPNRSRAVEKKGMNRGTRGKRGRPRMKKV